MVAVPYYYRKYKYYKMIKNKYHLDDLSKEYFVLYQ